jgi:peptidoglycan/LPS O-acetylase OafA/YrhL
VIAFVYSSHTSPLAVNEAEAMSAKLLRYSFIPHFSLFLAGVLLQRFQVHTRSWVRGKGVAYLAGYLVLFYALPDGTALHYNVTTLALTLVSISVAYTTPGIAHRVLRGNDISYGIYIFHGIVLNVMVQEGWGGGLGSIPVVVAVSGALAFASWKLVEQPVLRRKSSTRPVERVPAPR